MGAQPLKPQATAHTVHVKSFEVEKFHRLLLSQRRFGGKFPVIDNT